MDDPVSSDNSAARPERQPWLPLWLRIFWAAGALLIVLLGGIVVGMLIERNSYEDSVVLGAEWRELGDVVDHLESDSYYRPDDPETLTQWQESAESGAINGLLDASGDAYAQYLPPSEAAASSALLTGEYEGIGVSIGAGEAGEVEIMSIMLDSPAARADVRVGDVVAEVNATPIPTDGTDLAAELLRGEAGTDVSLVLERPGGDVLSLALTREEIETGETTIGYHYYPDADVGVIQIALFATTTVGELEEALAQAAEDGVERLVLDLRGNPGGWVSGAQGVIGRFLPDSVGPALQEDTHPAGGAMLQLPIMTDDDSRYSGELIVLVDENTASAAEIVAGALQDYDRAPVVGASTFGKGSVQRVYDFPSGESLRLTIAEWFTPEERRLQDAGIEPDVELNADASIEELLPDLAPLFDGDVTTGSPDATPVTGIESSPSATPQS